MNRTEKIKEIQQGMVHLQGLARKRDEKMDQLQRSLAVLEIWPEAFADGSITTRVVMRAWWTASGRERFEEDRKKKHPVFFVKTKGGEERGFGFDDLPTILQNVCMKKGQDNGSNS